MHVFDLVRRHGLGKVDIGRGCAGGLVGVKLLEDSAAHFLGRFILPTNEPRCEVSQSAAGRRCQQAISYGFVDALPNIQFSIRQNLQDLVDGIALCSACTLTLSVGYSLSSSACRSSLQLESICSKSKRSTMSGAGSLAKSAAVSRPSIIV